VHRDSSLAATRLGAALRSGRLTRRARGINLPTAADLPGDERSSRPRSNAGTMPSASVRYRRLQVTPIGRCGVFACAAYAQGTAAGACRPPCRRGQSSLSMASGFVFVWRRCRAASELVSRDGQPHPLRQLDPRKRRWPEPSAGLDALTVSAVAAGSPSAGVATTASAGARRDDVYEDFRPASVP
jgi:hypothetical protein